MKKIVIVAAVIIIFAAAWAGYSILNKRGATQNNTNPGQTAFRDAGNGRGDFEPPGLSGEVTSIAGNLVTLKIIEMPDFQSGLNRRQGSDTGPPPGGGGWTGGGDRQSGSGQGRQRNLKYTGERKEIIIPVGIPITAMVRTNTGREIKNVAFNKIKKGDILQIWYSDKAQENISRVGISSLGQSRS